MDKHRFNVVTRYIIRKFSLRADEETQQAAMQSIKDGVNFKGPNLWVLVFAIFMASLGLNVNSTAVIIGAMLISPLMGPIMGLGLGLGIYDASLLKGSLRNLLLAVVVSIITSTLYFLASPIKHAGSELLARTSPTVYDLLIAFFGGLAGIVAGSSKLRQSNVIPGVAIATALMPPICTAGYSFSAGHWADMLGALYLFLINSVFISLGTLLVVRMLKYPRQSYPDPARQSRIRKTITATVVVVAIPSFVLTYNILQKYFFTARTNDFITNEFSDNGHFVVNREAAYSRKKKSLQLVVLGASYDSMDLIAKKTKLKDYGLEDCELIVRQGFEDTLRESNIMNTLSRGIEVNSNAIQKLFNENDSLKKLTALKASLEKYEQSVAAAAALKVPDIIDFQMRQEAYYRVDSLRKVFKDSLWVIDVTTSRQLSSNERSQFYNWLQLSLAGKKSRITITP